MSFKDKPYIIAFTDVETAPTAASFDDLDHRAQQLFVKIFEKLFAADPIYKDRLPEEQARQYFLDKASFFAEFARVVSVSTGFLHDGKFKLKTLANRDEAALLRELSNIYVKADILVAHYGKEFDFPFLMRRYLINGIPIPPVLNVMGKKPWEVSLQDTMEMWSGTQWKYRVSLDLLSYGFGIPSPKQDIDGGMVKDLFYSGKDEDLKRIATYCEGDVLTLANVYYAMKGQKLIRKDQIVRVE